MTKSSKRNGCTVKNYFSYGVRSSSLNHKLSGNWQQRTTWRGQQCCCTCGLVAKHSWGEDRWTPSEWEDTGSTHTIITNVLWNDLPTTERKLEFNMDKLTHQKTSLVRTNAELTASRAKGAKGWNNWRANQRMAGNALGSRNVNHMDDSKIETCVCKNQRASRLIVDRQSLLIKPAVNHNYSKEK
jgi:hypothetical protein